MRLQVPPFPRVVSLRCLMGLTCPCTTVFLSMGYHSRNTAPLQTDGPPATVCFLATSPACSQQTRYSPVTLLHCAGGGGGVETGGVACRAGYSGERCLTYAAAVRTAQEVLYTLREVTLPTVPSNPIPSRSVDPCRLRVFSGSTYRMLMERWVLRDLVVVAGPRGEHHANPSAGPRRARPGPGAGAMRTSGMTSTSKREIICLSLPLSLSLFLAHRLGLGCSFYR